MKYIELEEVGNLSRKEIEKIYKKNYNEVLYKIFRYAGIDKNFIMAKGMQVYDENMEEYLDFLGGYGALNLGHNDSRIIEVVNGINDKPNLLQSSINTYASVLANNISYLTGENFRNCFFTNSGTETVEEAIKLALLYNPDGKIIYFKGAYHGKTLGSLSALGSDEKYKYAPLLDNFIEVPFGDINAIKDVISKFDIAAILAEPIQGEGGVIIAPQNFFKEVSKLCDKNDIILILDEIQTGLGRTGTMFCYEQLGFIPDILCLSKALSGGVMPIGCMCVEETLWDSTYGKAKNGELLGSTFGGNTLACAVAIKTLSIIKDEKLDKKAKELGDYALKKLIDLKKKHRIIKDVRGKGLLIGIEISNLGNKIPDNMMKFMVATIISKLINEFKIISGFTTNNPSVLRFEPPLIVTEKHIDYFIESLDSVLNEEGNLVKLSLSAVKNMTNIIM